VIDYSPLWQTMKEKGFSQYKLLRKGLDCKVYHNMRHGKRVNISTIEKLCLIMDCTPNDIFRIVKDSPEEATPD